MSAVDPAADAGYDGAMARERTDAGWPKPGRRGRDSKELILDRALDLLGAEGYGGLSISAVCKAAGVSPTSIYWHFGDKAGLMSALLKHSLRCDFEIFLASFEVERRRLPLGAAYRRVLRDVIARERPSSWAVIAMLAEGRNEAPAIPALVGEARRKQVAFARGWGEALAEAADPDVFADAVVALNAFAAAIWQTTRDLEEVDRVLGSLETLMRMLAPSFIDRVVDDAAFERCMARWGWPPAGADPLERSDPLDRLEPPT